jgi:hypothetical protein
MNLILRMIKVLVAALFGQPLGILDSSVLTFRVWPNDLDINLHMNNGRYLTIMAHRPVDPLGPWRRHAETAVDAGSRSGHDPVPPLAFPLPAVPPAHPRSLLG